MNALAVVSIYVVTNRAPYLKCDPSVSVYVAVVWIPDHPTGPDLREGLCQTMLLVTIMTLKIDPSVSQPYKFNPLEAGRAEPEFIVQLLEQFVGAKLSAEKKTSILAVIAELPEGAGMRDLCEAIKAQEAASLGVTVQQYQALSPVLEVLQGMLVSGDHAALFEQPADV